MTQSSVKMLKKRGRKFFPPFEFLVIERFHISQNLHKSILPITGVYLNMNRGMLSRASLAHIFVFSCRAEQNSMIFLSSCTVKALLFFAEYRSETILRIGFKSAGKSSAKILFNKFLEDYNRYETKGIKKFNQHKKLTKENLFATMNIVSQKPTFVNQLLYSYRNSIFATIRRFGVSRATIYRWRKRYNGTTQSLVEYSRRPHSHPNQQTKLMQRGYKRSIPALWRILRKLSLLPVKPPNPNIFQSLTSLCFIPVKEFRLT